MHDSLIARFTRNHPCWTAALLERAGEDPAGLDALEEDGLLARQDDALWLTDRGRVEFARASAELYLFEQPGDVPTDPIRSLMATELWMELERCNLQHRGLKRYLFRPTLPARPALGRGEVWRLDGPEPPSFHWLYPEAPTFKKIMANRRTPTTSERQAQVPDPEALNEWLALPPEPFIPDLMYITNYDFEHYLDFKGHPGDEMKLINTDRFAFSMARGLEQQLDELGRFQRWIFEQRLLRFPGYFDLDTQEQSSVTWLIFVTEAQAEALALQESLKALGPALIEPANPMEVWTLSLEAMRACPSRREVIWDVLPHAGQAARLTL